MSLSPKKKIYNGNETIEIKLKAVFFCVCVFFFILVNGTAKHDYNGKDYWNISSFTLYL